jgi:hypothetical protein
MTIHVLERRPTRRPASSPHFTLSHDEDGWTLFQPDGCTRQFASLEAGIDGAREFPAPQTVSIDVWQDGEYICCLPPEQWSHVAPATAAAPQSPLFPTAERYANRFARVMMAVAGPVFWVAMVAAVLAASLGWRLLLL